MNLRTCFKGQKVNLVIKSGLGSFINLRASVSTSRQVLIRVILFLRSYSNFLQERKSHSSL